ncbi:hypothetical protein HBH56_120920 [Parastagonospora nodorum]|nr:hypothetical protein HBH56_120920 [Parastagonospora nodorum]KAH4203153.1 hypothetical protein HBI95_154940 [Parastagonospora nodorum]KAH4561161.1 hypothetical protein HBH84_193290 [Parastagonospora nodorum]KAH4982015.1 hypothetical protein HBI76_161790 [Parastagonospora nodorum]KAH5052078.1 hypothetical protein HBH96_166220 [Parastagonospora nodorum]
MMTLTFESPKADTHIHHHILPGFSETTNLASTRETSALDVRHLLFELSETTIFENTREKSISLDMKHTHLLPAAQHNHISIARTRHHSPVAHPTLHRLPDPVPRLSPTMQDHLHHLSLTAHTILNHHRDSSLDPVPPLAQDHLHHPFLAANHTFDHQHHPRPTTHPTPDHLLIPSLTITPLCPATQAPRPPPHPPGRRKTIPRATKHGPASAASRRVSVGKKVRWGGVEVMGDDGYVGSEER